VAAAAIGISDPRTSAQQQPPTPTFKAGVELVSLSAVVRDRKGRFVENLTRGDFQVFEGLEERPIVDFGAETSAPISVTMLFDVSGSMRVSGKLEQAKQAASHLLDWLEPGKDEAALFYFDQKLHEAQPYTLEPERVKQRLGDMEPFGATSLYDAVAQAAKRAGERKSRRRAVVVITDGVDTASRLTPPQVSGIASSIEAAVYVLAVVSPVDHQGAATAVEGDAATSIGSRMADLAYWTGGDVFFVSAPAHASAAARQVVTELRRQYLIAFEPTAALGWRPLSVRTKNQKWVVRTRTGYFSGQERSDAANRPASKEN
jgi:Ca-activated chloride channel homolog